MWPGLRLPVKARDASWLNNSLGKRKGFGVWPQKLSFSLSLSSFLFLSFPSSFFCCAYLIRLSASFYCLVLLSFSRFFFISRCYVIVTAQLYLSDLSLSFSLSSWLWSRHQQGNKSSLFLHSIFKSHIPPFSPSFHLNTLFKSFHLSFCLLLMEVWSPSPRPPPV